MKLELQAGSRSRILAILILTAMAVFIVRLFYLQVIMHETYVTLANQEQIRRLVIPARRGEIYAMDGTTPVKIVLNESIYTAFADPKVVKDSSKVVETVQNVAGGSAQPNLSQLLSNKQSRYAVLAKGLTRHQADLIKAQSLNGVGFQEETQRVYPEGSLAAQTLGFVNGEGKGQYGIEGGMNAQLTGKDGLLQSVADVNDVPLTVGRNNVKQPAQNGQNVVLTTDRNVQSYTEQALMNGLKKSGATNGSVIVMDPQTGRVLAMANAPSFDPANFGQVSSAAAYNNATISAPYEPGSDIKTLTMATGIDKGVVHANDTYNNTDYVRVDDITVSNATKGQTGNITFQHALNYSLNTGFVTVAERLGDGRSITLNARNTMYDYFHDRLGLGRLTGIQLAGEQGGIVIPPSDPQGNAVRYSNMAFGQGLDVTMLQVSAAFSAIINGGTYHTPSVVAGAMNDDGSTFMPAQVKAERKGVVAPSTSDEIRTMVHDARAAFYAGKDRAGYYIGGKTGTSQTIENGTYVDNQTIGTYLGFGGDSNSSTGPKYVIMVQVSGKNMNLAGNTDAMPIFTDISNWMLDYMKLLPKG